jgi:hypothetical protein
MVDLKLRRRIGRDQDLDQKESEPVADLLPVAELNIRLEGPGEVAKGRAERLSLTLMLKIRATNNVHGKVTSVVEGFVIKINPAPPLTYIHSAVDSSEEQFPIGKVTKTCKVEDRFAYRARRAK